MRSPSNRAEPRTSALGTPLGAKRSATRPTLRAAVRVMLKALAFLARLACAEAITLVPLAAFLRILAAEGPMPLLYGWVATLEFLVSVLTQTRGRNKGIDAGPTPRDARPLAIRAARACLFVIATAIGLLGVFVIVLQVMVVPRSLAEAWLEMTRSGDAFGFFSFFASEIYAIFLVAQAILFIRGRYAMFASAFLATLFLCVGVIAGNGLVLLLSALSALALFLLAQRDASRKSGVTVPVRERLRSIAPPLALACAISLVYATNPDAFTPNGTPMPQVSASALLVSLVPAFPLLRDVPGYGFTSDATAMPSSVFLSSRILFRVKGDPFAVLYLGDETYRKWDGRNWLVEPDPGEDIPTGDLVRRGFRRPGTVTLTLEDDFTTSVPVTNDTSLALIPNDAPKNRSATRNTGVRFEPGIKRGFVAELELGAVDGEAASAGALTGTIGSSDAQSERIAELARALGAGRLTEREYAQSLLDYFSTGYEYTLRTENADGKGNPIETFLFREKKGFCLYFASAFALLAREAGIPARLRGGYRVALDENGDGVISGNNAHSWPELYIEGGWRTFEPTPALRDGDPFAWTPANDLETRRQLEALYGANAGETDEEDKTAFGKFLSALGPFAVPAAIAIAGIVSLMALARKLLDRGTRRLRRIARKAVARYRKRGVAGPEETGWTVWERTVAEMEADDKARRDEAGRIAKAMIALTFAPVREGTPA
jgi:hypothetical protein